MLRIRGSTRWCILAAARRRRKTNNGRGCSVFMQRRSVLALAAAGLVVPSRTLLAEPLTAGAAAALVAVKLLEGALQYAGGQILAHALGAATITDVRTWIVAAVAQIQAFVSEELRKQLSQLVLDEMAADLQGVVSHINQYAALLPENQVKNRAILESVNNTTAAAIPRTSKYDQASPIIAGLMAYRLIARNGLYQLDKDPGHIRGMRADMDEYVRVMKGIRERILPPLAPAARLKGLGCRGLPPGEGTKNQAECRYTIDGAPISTITNPPKYTQKMFEAELAATLQRQRDVFAAQLESYLGEATSAYDAMCRTVGDTYPISGTPGAIEKALAGNAMQGIISAPGAFIQTK